MRKTLILTSLFIALFLQQGRAQFGGIFENTYFLVKAGPNYYLNDANGTFGGGVDIGYGKWLINTMSLRGFLSAEYANRGYKSEMIFYGRADAVFDLYTSIKGRNTSDFRSYLYLGIGVVHTMSNDNDFSGTIGIGGDWKMNSNWRLVSELEMRIHPSDFDDNKRSSFMPALSLGLERDINNNPTRSRSRDETRRFGNDWFFLIGLGLNSMNYKGIGSFQDREKLFTPIFEFGIGKTITKYWSGRLIASGLYGKSHVELFSYYNVCGDMLFDFMGLFVPNPKNTLFDVKPYAGACIVARLDNQSNFLFSTDLGLLLLCRPLPKNEFFIDARYILTPPRFAHVPIRQNKFSVGLATLMVGYSYTFTHSSF